MGYYLSEPAPSKGDLTAKNRVWGFFGESVSVILETRRAVLETHRENYGGPGKTASGIPLWPSRDPIGERGGVNLYGFVGNDGVNWWDFLGLFESPGAAAHAAGEKYIKEEHDSAKKQFEEEGTAMVLMERCGRICCKKSNGTFYTTVAERKWSWARDGALGCSPNKAEDCGGEDKQIGWWHTHPGRTSIRTVGRTNEEKKQVLDISRGGPFNGEDKKFVNGIVGSNTGKHLPHAFNQDHLPLTMTRLDFEGNAETVIYVRGNLTTTPYELPDDTED